MLVLSRRVGEEIVIGDGIRLRVTSVVGKRARIGVTAPAEVRVLRAELPAKPTPDESALQEQLLHGPDDVMPRLAGTS